MFTRHDLIKLFGAWSDTMIHNRENLIELDSVFGDGDLGLTMSDGFAAAYKTMLESPETDLGKLVYFAGKAMSTAVPSTMGTLMAYGLMNAGKELKGLTELAPHDLGRMFEAWCAGIKNMGKAQLGDKTILDSFEPAVTAFATGIGNSGDLSTAAGAAAAAAHQGFDRATDMLARHGRAATRGENSRGVKDPGAAVAVLLMETLAKFQI